MKKTNMSEDNLKMQKKCEKLWKNSPTWPQEPPKREGTIWTTVSALPCLAPTLESKKHQHYLRVLIQHAEGRGPPRIVTPSELARQRGGLWNEDILPKSSQSSFKIFPQTSQ